MTHTPGTWKKEGDHIVARDILGKVSNGSNSIAVVYGPDKEDNANLIAAVTELLARLKQARDAIASLPGDALGVEVAGDGRSHWHIKDELMGYIDAAIAQAEGGAQ